VKTDPSMAMDPAMAKAIFAARLGQKLRWASIR
jgi:hypothetical protein